MIKRIFFTVLAVSLVFLPARGSGLRAAMTSTNYQIWADGFSAGGNDSTSSGYQLEDTVQMSGGGNISSTNYASSSSGFIEQRYPTNSEALTLSIGSSNLSFGDLNTALAKTASTVLTVYTNSYYGVSVTYSGNTLSNGGSQITAIGPTSAVSNPGTSQFGFNVIENPVASAPKAAATTNYNNATKYAFNSNDQIITSSRDINPTIFDLNYLANISGFEAPGSYSASMTFTALANF
jgi:hypothetical protein